MVTVKVYVEGGGDKNKDLKAECRQGFSEFFKKLGVQPKIIACGGRSTAFNDFRKALKKLKNDEYCLLLVDSEAPVTTPSKWQHVYLRQGDNWQKPDNATEEQLHFMVECMEAWFMADKKSLANYYGKDFKESVLPQNSNIEDILKSSLLNSLENATKNTSKGKYSKGGHSFDILSQIDANKVIANSAYAKRLYEYLRISINIETQL
jgi:hypothetical protein